jgi:hypothetical protein
MSEGTHPAPQANPAAQPAPASATDAPSPENIKAAALRSADSASRLTADAPTPEVLKAALKAFRKRLKLTRLDDASRIGRGPMSSGQGSTIAAITPPDQYPRAVWETLAKQGKLIAAGHGMYSLVQ